MKPYITKIKIKYLYKKDQHLLFRTYWSKSRDKSFIISKNNEQ